MARTGAASPAAPAAGRAGAGAPGFPNGPRRMPVAGGYAAHCGPSGAMRRCRSHMPPGAGEAHIWCEDPAHHTA